MNLMCPLCKKVIVRDGRKIDVKYFMTKRGYKSWCDKYQKDVFMRKNTRRKI